MMQKNQVLQGIFQSFPVRIFIIGVLGLFVLIPLFFVQYVVQERYSRYQAVSHEIASNWGEPQTFKGPFLIIPFVDHIIDVDTVTDELGESKTVTRNIFKEKSLVVLPDKLNIDVSIQERLHQKGIYNAVVYSAKLSLAGSFDYASLVENIANNRSFKWDKAQVLFGLSDIKGINNHAYFIWDKKKAPLNSGVQSVDFIQSGFSSPLKEMLLADSNTHHQFKLQLSFKGSQGFQITPLGKATEFDITSTWPHTLLKGQLQPYEYDVTNNGFSAKWNIPYLARNYPQNWILSEKNYNLKELTVGVDIINPASFYSKILHSTKYGVVFIVITFLTLLIFEALTELRLKSIYYIVVGVAFSLFYLILLSLAEHVTFFAAYITASSITIITIGLYAFYFLKMRMKSGILLVLLIALYGVLYILLIQEDYALLSGVSLLLLILISIMYATLNIKSYDS